VIGMKHIALAMLLVACKSKSSEPASKPAETKATKPAETKPVDTKPAPDTDEGFKTAVTDLAKRHKWIVAAWGTAMLDDAQAGHDRWAQLAPDPKTANGNDDKGAYLVQGGDTFYLIELGWDDKTQPWMGAPEATPAWKNDVGAFIEHQQAYAGGFVQHQLAIRKGEVVVLRKTEKNRGEDEHATAYADLAGSCVKPCPKASDDGYTEKSAKSIAAL
jgi:hypothetical protein